MLPEVEDIIGASRELIKDDGALRRKIGKEGLATSYEVLSASTRTYELSREKRRHQN